MIKFEENGLKDCTKMIVGEYFFQGDVIVKKIEHIKNLKDVKSVKNNILAEGEATGHVHKVIGNCRVIKSNDYQSDLYLEVFDESTLYHQEHSPLKIGPGFYKIEIQREYNHFLNIIDLVYD